ncbi:MAG: FlgD immunoglobulin-like domain containing protein [Patescibacteria group bacterium]
MKKLWLIPILIALLTTLVSSPVQAEIRIEQSLPVVTEMSGTGFAIDQKIEGDVLTLTFDIADKADISNFGFGLKFDPSEYKLEQVESGFVISSDDPSEVNVFSLFTLNDVPTTIVITLRKKGAEWGTISPQELNVFTGSRHMIAFEPAPAFTPKAVPRAMSLDNYPNPFNPETTIKYSVPSDGVVKLTIYNALGQSVRTLVDGHQRAGEYAIIWNATNDTGQPMADGLYFYRITTPNGDLIRKMLLLK